jgi:hypothetical protein
MPRIRVTQEVYGLIIAHATLSFNDTSKVLPGGVHEFDVSEDILDRITECMFEGETVSDMLMRMFAHVDGKNRN